jgi:hypothetical protein
MDWQLRVHAPQRISDVATSRQFIQSELDTSVNSHGSVEGFISQAPLKKLPPICYDFFARIVTARCSNTLAKSILFHAEASAADKSFTFK